MTLDTMAETIGGRVMPGLGVIRCDGDLTTVLIPIYGDQDAWNLSYREPARPGRDAVQVTYHGLPTETVLALVVGVAA